jgi:hypothetical protein
LVISTTNARWFQLFRYQDGYLVNERGKVVDVSGGRDMENQNIHMWNKHGGENQQWDIWYADELPPELKKGDLNKDWGFRIDTDFHIESKMASKRYIDFLSNNAVLKTPNGRKTQLFYFDNITKTIRCRDNKYSFNIQSSGRG